MAAGTPLRDFGPEYSLNLDSQDILAAMEYCGISELIGEDINGYLYNVDNPDDIWFTESNAPWKLHAIYYQPKYWTEVDKVEQISKYEWYS